MKSKRNQFTLSLQLPKRRVQALRRIIRALIQENVETAVYGIDPAFLCRLLLSDYSGFPIEKFSQCNWSGDELKRLESAARILCKSKIWIDHKIDKTEGQV